MLGAILGAIAGAFFHRVAIHYGAASAEGAPWMAIGYGALLGGTALMGV
jgi:hypothetical protein